MRSPIASVHRHFTLGLITHLLRKAFDKRAQGFFAPLQGRMLYVAQSARPYDINGYTSRTHELVLALQKEGDVHVCTRCGYPWDRHKLGRQADPIQEKDFGFPVFSTLEEGVRYLHLPAPKNNCLTAIYAGRASRSLENLCRKLRPALIHAASNHVSALPALIAAKHLGIPFQYEMRGLWELSRLANNPNYQRSHNLALGLELEGFVARHADRVFVISKELARYARKTWQIEENRLVLLPNCVNAKRLEDGGSQKNSPLLLGYAGSLVRYEGLDVLLQALKILKDTCGPACPHLEIAGSGSARKELEALATALELGDTVTFLGKLSPGAALARIKSWDMVCLPRRADMVCQLIPPLKLVEAMAMGKAILVPDLPLFRAETGNLGNFFEPGNPQSLAKVLAHLLESSAGLALQGQANRQYVLEKRLWRHFVPEVLALANNVHATGKSPC